MSEANSNNSYEIDLNLIGNLLNLDENTKN